MEHPCQSSKDGREKEGVQTNYIAQRPAGWQSYACTEWGPKPVSGLSGLPLRRSTDQKAMAVSAFATPMSNTCRAQDHMRLADQATASFSGRPPAGNGCSQQSSFCDPSRRTRSHRKLYLPQEHKRTAICLATKSERRKQMQQAEEDAEEEASIL